MKTANTNMKKTTKQIVDRWVNTKTCSKIHEQLEKLRVEREIAVEKRQAERDTIIMNELKILKDGNAEIIKEQIEIRNRLYKDNGKKSIQTKQNEHDLLIQQLADSNDRLSTIVSRVSWTLIVGFGSILLSVVGYFSIKLVEMLISKT